MAKNAKDIIKHDSWLHVSLETLVNLTSRDSLKLREVDIFSAVQKWAQYNSDTDVKRILGK